MGLMLISKYFMDEFKSWRTFGKKAHSHVAIAFKLFMQTSKIER